MPKSHLEMLVMFICSSWLPPEVELTAAPVCFLLARRTVNVVAAQVMLLRVREKEKLALYALPWSLAPLPQLSHSRQLTSGCPGNLGLAWDLSSGRPKTDPMRSIISFFSRHPSNDTP